MENATDAIRHPGDNNDDDDITVVPARHGRLIPLRTPAEVAATLHLLEARVVCLRAADVQQALKLIDSSLPPRSELPSLHHVRRITPIRTLPLAVQGVIDPTYSPESAYPLALLAAPASILTESALASTLTDTPYTTHTVHIPQNAPADQASAEQWSRAYWPTVYRAHNPFGPQPAQWRDEERKLGPGVGQWMAAARYLGLDAARSGRGKSIGAVIVDPVTQRIVAGAGDARWHDMQIPGSSSAAAPQSKTNNPLAHATMRAIALVGRQRVALAAAAEAAAAAAAAQSNDDAAHSQHGPDNAQQSSSPTPPSAALHDAPLSPAEAALQRRSPLLPDGYLCTQLAIVVTHEPCVMCAMAIVHSRFQAVVFEHALGTGGLMAERSGGAEPGGAPAEQHSGASAEPGGASAEQHSGAPAEEHSGALAEHDTTAAAAQKHTDASAAPPAPPTPAHPGVAYGLWHRPELNWRPMAWHWEDDACESDTGSEADADAAAYGDMYHA